MNCSVYICNFVILVSPIFTNLDLSGILLIRHKGGDHLVTWSPDHIDAEWALAILVDFRMAEFKGIPGGW